mmetsp:Transcript_48587/g.155479  ORF Transcript_48587/g.155479 Transcript_48587/m.155479 type:complete len:173 (+) Transcript_48587:563-1081(+)
MGGLVESVQSMPLHSPGAGRGCGDGGRLDGRAMPVNSAKPGTQGVRGRLMSMFGGRGSIDASPPGMSDEAGAAAPLCNPKGLRVKVHQEGHQREAVGRSPSRERASGDRVAHRTPICAESAERWLEVEGGVKAFLPEVMAAAQLGGVSLEPGCPTRKQELSNSGGIFRDGKK